MTSPKLSLWTLVTTSNAICLNCGYTYIYSFQFQFKRKCFFDAETDRVEFPISATLLQTNFITSSLIILLNSDLYDHRVEFSRV